MSSQARGGAEVLVVGGIVAGLIALLFYLLGVLVAAHGQVLQATLDSAVNSSPFLTDADKAEIMSLSRVSSTSTTSMDEAGEVVGEEEWKCRCGQINSKELANCPKCGRVPGAII